MSTSRSLPRNVSFYDATHLDVALGGFVQNGSITEENFLDILGMLPIIEEGPIRVQERMSSHIVSRTGMPLQAGVYDIYCECMCYMPPFTRWSICEFCQPLSKSALSVGYPGWFLMKSVVEKVVSVMVSVIAIGNLLFQELRFLKSISRPITGPLLRLPISSLPRMKDFGYSIITEDRLQTWMML